MLNKAHEVRITFTGESGVTITRTVKAPTGSRNRGEALARVKATVGAYVPKGAIVVAVTLP